MPERTPEEVLALVKDEGCEFVDLRFCDLPGVMQHVSIPAHVLERGPLRRRPRLRRLVGPRVPGDPGIGHGPDPRPEHRVHRPVHERARRWSSTASWPTRSPASATRRDPRYVAQKAEELPEVAPASPTPPTSAPRPSSSSSTTCASRPSRTARFYQVDSVEGAVEHRHRRGPEPRLQAPHQGGLLPGPADGPLPGPALRDGRWRCTRSASRPSCTTTRWPPAARARSTSGSTRCSRMADKLMIFKYVLKNVAWQAGKIAHVHAEADLRGQRLGHAHPPVAVEGRRAAVLRRGRLRRPVRPRPLVHRRPAPPRPRGHRLHQPDHQQLQAAGAGLRGAGEPGLQPAQPLGVVPHPARASRARRPSASSSAAPTPRRTRTSPSRR